MLGKKKTKTILVPDGEVIKIKKQPKCSIKRCEKDGTEMMYHNPIYYEKSDRKKCYHHKPLGEHQKTAGCYGNSNVVCTNFRTSIQLIVVHLIHTKLY